MNLVLPMDFQDVKNTIKYQMIHSSSMKSGNSK